jgi:hypothetical protein
MDDELMTQLEQVVEKASRTIADDVWKQLELLERSRMLDTSVPLDDRVGAACDRALKVRALAEEGIDVGTALMAIWKAAQDVVWREGESDPEIVRWLPVDDPISFFYLFFSVFGQDPDMWKPWMQQLEATAGEEERELVDDLLALCEG